MKSFAGKVKDARAELGLSQAQLSEQIGVSIRSIQLYERGIKRPRQSTALKLAKELKVSVRFLTDDECENPLKDIEMDGYIGEARERYGLKGAIDVNLLLEANVAFFSDKGIIQNEKDDFFEAVMKAYIASKDGTNI